MKLLVILASLGFERYLNAGFILKRFVWFGGYVAWLRKVAHADILWKGPNGVVFVIAPIVILVAIIYLLLGHFFYGTIGMALSFIVLLYCLGPNDLHHQLKMYFSAKENNDSNSVKSQIEKLLPQGVPVDEKQQHRALTKMIFTEANTSLFAVLFWFLILGPVGAVLYRLSALLHCYLENETNYDKKMVSAAIIWHELLDWIPARIVGLLYGLAGNLNQSFSVWMKLLFSGLQNNRELLTTCGLSALDSQEQNLNENKAALATVDRVLIITLVFIAIFTLGALIY